jgi:hypothetical protein
MILKRLMDDDMKKKIKEDGLEALDRALRARCELCSSKVKLKGYQNIAVAAVFLLYAFLVIHFFG